MPVVKHQRYWFWRGYRVRYGYQGSQTQGVPLLLVHGFGAALEHWRYNAPVLGEHHPVYALDLLGFGDAQKASAQYGVRLWVAQVYEFWRTFIGQPVCLVGHSLGALVSLTAAVAHPDMVRGLVLISLPEGRPTLQPAWLNAWVGGLERLLIPVVTLPLFYVLRQPGVIRWVCRSQVYQDPEVVNAALVQMFARPAQESGAGLTLCRLAQASSRPGYAPRVAPLLAALSVPGLLIWGQQDRLIPIQQGQKWIQQFPHLQWAAIPAGHCPQDEAPLVVNQLLDEWLQQWGTGL
ncbi:alpha/beta fold hydrolase [Gloeomargarita lithophora]|uniref:alpha/beta fold hydrolase n=1 Tax=Gloeomargarita lithophora TaxID=1188228 RepID=UPI0008F861E2|nr:alpha/beta fold hydrolase [Gloeomargarita lithophora]